MKRKKDQGPVIAMDPNEVVCIHCGVTWTHRCQGTPPRQPVEQVAREIAEALERLLDCVYDGERTVNPPTMADVCRAEDALRAAGRLK